MSYPRRIFIPNLSVHVYSRGINGEAITRDEDDTEHLRRALVKAAGEEDVQIHAFAFMTTHFHLIVTPANEDALPQTIEIANGLQTKYINRKYKRTGTIWNERYGASVLADERYWYRCLRYVDLNPFRAHIVSSPGESRRSSYRVHAFGDACDWLTPHPLYLRLGSTRQERQTAYRAMCDRPLTDDELEEQRQPRRRRIATAASVSAAVSEV